MKNSPMTRDIPALVRAIRAAKGLTQEQLAREIGVTFSTINGWENGRHHPIPALVAVLERLGREIPRTRDREGHSPRQRTARRTP